MLRITNLTLARGTKRLLEGAKLTVHPGHKLGLVGANGSGKSSLFAALRHELIPDAGSIDLPAGVGDRARRAGNAAGRRQRARLRARRRPRAARRRGARSPRRRPIPRTSGEALADLHQRFDAIGGYSAPRARRHAAGRAGLRRSAARRARRELLRRLAHAPEPRAGADVPLRPAAARRADQPPRPRRRAVARGLARPLSGHAAADHARPRLPRRAWSTASSHVERAQAHARTPATTRSSSASAREQLALQQATYDKQQRQVAHLQAFIDRFRAKATKAQAGAEPHQGAGADGADRRRARRQPVRVHVSRRSDTAARQLVLLERRVARLRRTAADPGRTSTGACSRATASACSAPTAPASRRC